MRPCKAGEPVTKTRFFPGFHCRRVVCACSAGTVGPFSNKPLSPKRTRAAAPAARRAAGAGGRAARRRPGAGRPPGAPGATGRVLCTVKKHSCVMTQPEQIKHIHAYGHTHRYTLCRYRQERARTHHTCAVSREITSLRTAPRRELAQTDRCARRRVRRLPSRDGREQGGDAGMRGLPNIRRVRRAAARRRD